MTQRQARKRLRKAFRIHILGNPEGTGRCHGMHGRTIAPAINKACGMAHGILHRHRAPCRFSFNRAFAGKHRGRWLRHLHLHQWRQPGADRVCHQQPAFLDQRKCDHARDGLGHGSDGENRIRLHRRAAFRIAVANCFQMHQLAIACDGHNTPRQPSGGHFTFHRRANTREPCGGHANQFWPCHRQGRRIGFNYWAHGAFSPTKGLLCRSAPKLDAGPWPQRNWM